MEFEKNYLEKHAVNMTKIAKEKKVDPIIGRDEEIRSIIRILSRKTKNNPVLIGEPGVGKTAIIEGLAQRINSGDVPEQLKNKEIYSLDLTSIVAGAKFQGEFEERLKGIMKEVSENNDKYILFIDEIHMIIGMGKTSGAMDGANILKPLLARGELNCIGATTLTEYKENIEKDPAFERRFQKVIVAEPTVDEAINILRGLKFSLEAYHGVQISDEAIITAVKSSNRYINERFLPDKAIDLVDEAAANINVQINSEPEDIEKLNQTIVSKEIEAKALKGSNKEKYKQVKEELSKLKDEYQVISEEWKRQKNNILKQKELKEKIKESVKLSEIARNDLKYEKAAEYEYSIIPNLKRELEELKIQEIDNMFIKDVVESDNINAIISKLTNIPLESLKQTSKEKLLKLEKRINDNVIGQEKAANEVANSIIRNRLNLSNPNRPIGSFLFLGPTGVGKTELSKVLAKELFDSKDKMFRIDMSEYMEKHSVSRLIGAPPGYIGFEEGGKLTEHIRTNPYSIVLFDEIEKAHPDVLNLLLQILDDGKLTNSKGKEVNFKNTIIILTSNIGAKEIMNKTLKDGEINKYLLNYFKPEFINRIDNIIKFNSMNKEMYTKITKLLLKELKEKLQENKIELEISDDLVEYIYNNSFEVEYGARPIKRFIQNKIETIIAYYLLENEEVEKIKIVVEDEKLIIK